MKFIKNIKSLIVVGLMLQAGIGFAWESTGPTADDIRSATKVESLAAKGSLEDKLINAVKNGNLKDVETFIAKGASLEARDSNNMTALMRAAEKGHAEIARMLIDGGANINAQGKFRETAFFYAADKKHVDVVKVLLAKGIAVDDTVKDFFVSFAFQGNIEMVKAFIESGRMSDDILDSACTVVRSRSEMYNMIVEARNK